MENNISCEKKKSKETFLELKLASLDEGNQQLKMILERIERLELKLSGSRTQKLEKDGSCDEASVQESSMTNSFNTIISEIHKNINTLRDSTAHLEELI